MCTAISFKTKDFYFGRTLDYDVSFSEEVTITPRNVPLPFRSRENLDRHCAIIGMAHVLEDYPLYFDAVNEKGLAMAGLNFVGNAVYNSPEEGRENIASFELIPWILGQCASIADAKKQLEKINLTNLSFNDDLEPSQLHWMIADSKESIVVEAVREGLRVYPNPVGVLTNNPTFPEQLLQLRNYMHLTPQEPENRFSAKIDLEPYSRGMGALGLPGDLSSQSRFVRAAFTRLNSQCGMEESESVGQFFHILGTVAQTRGCCITEENRPEITRYTSCCNTDKGIYYYTTYQNRQVTAVHIYRENLEGSALIRYPLILTEQIHSQN